MKFEKHKLEKTRLKFASLQKRFYISFQHHLLLLNFDFHEQTIFIYIYCCCCSGTRLAAMQHRQLRQVHVPGRRDKELLAWQRHKRT